MEVFRTGAFMETIGHEYLSKGLRPSAKLARNNGYLVECVGAVGIDNVLQTLNDLSLSRIDTSVITDGFPYPQLFIFPNITLVCGQSDIYSYLSGVLALELGSLTPGNIWSAISVDDFVYMTNKVVGVVRDPGDLVFRQTGAYPIADALCNFNMQVFVGSPIDWDVSINL